MREKNIILKTAIFKEGTTQRAVALKAGISEAVLSMIINGKYNPNKRERKRIARAIGRDERELFVQA